MSAGRPPRHGGSRKSEPAVFARAKDLGVRVDGRSLASFEPCSTLEAEWWLLDVERVGGDASEGPITVCVDGVGGPAACSIRRRRR